MKKTKIAKVSFSITVLLYSLFGVLNADCPAGGCSIKKATVTNNTGYDLRIDVQDREGRALGIISCSGSSDQEKVTITSEASEFFADGSIIIFTRESKRLFVYRMQWDGNQAVVENKSLNLKINFERINEEVRIEIEERNLFQTTIEDAVKKTIKEKDDLIRKQIKKRLKKF